MIATLSFVGLALATIFAALAAVLCNWLLLCVMFHLMRPAAVRKTSEGSALKRPTVRTEFVRGAEELTRAFAPNRRAI
jgi:hypothetical protein